MKFPISTLFLFIVFLLGQSLTGQSLKQADDLLAAAINDGKFVGVNAGIAVADEIKWLGAAGDCSADRQTACNPTTIHRIASISKTITAVAALQLYEQGKLDLDLPIAHYLPAYPAFAAEQITTRHLLQHTAGIGGYASSKESETTQEYPSLAAACAVFQDRELLFEPGSRYQYTTYGYVVLGWVIEAASGQPFSEYLQSNIFEPAGMTTAGVEVFGKAYENKSAFFYRNKRGKLKNADVNNLSNRVPGGGIYASVPDLLKFGQALLSGTLLQDSTFAIMQTAPEVDRGENNPYGMGLFLYGDNPLVGPVMGHPGEQTGAAGQLMLFPEKQAVIVVLSNTALALRDAFQLTVSLFPVIAK